ncbi:hypothetical protein [Mycolicibacterium sp.]|uniref:hypothetical protein n=1 Tax=Mycolicibacterium sp. TaxID=2320850 RepID=UPI003D0CB453
MTSQDSEPDEPTTVRMGVRERATFGQASREYSQRLGAMAAFTVRHKALVIGAWVG